MRYLLDTHAFLWGLQDDPRLSPRVRSLLLAGEHALLWSAASTWELAIKCSLGRVRFAAPLAAYLPGKLSAEGIEELPITSDHAARTEALPWHHRDPFDRLLVAQAQAERVPIITADPQIARYEVEVFW